MIWGNILRVISSLRLHMRGIDCNISRGRAPLPSISMYLHALFDRLERICAVRCRRRRDTNAGILNAGGYVTYQCSNFLQIISPIFLPYHHSFAPHS